MKYLVEGVSYTSKAAATKAARQINTDTGRAVKIEWGDSTEGTNPEWEWIGRESLVADCEDLEPVDRTERLQRRAERAPGTELPATPEQ